MKFSTTVKMFALAITATVLISVSNAQAGKKLYISGPVGGGNGGSCKLAPPRIPTLGIYGVVTCKGMLVTDVVRGSEAWKIGLERGDVIMAIDGIHIHDEDDYDFAMRRTGRHTDLRVLDSRGRGVFNIAAHLFDNQRVRPVLKSRTALRY